MRCARFLLCCGGVVALALVAGPCRAQGYGEQRPLQFRIQGADHTTQEVYRYQNSTSAIAASRAAGLASASTLNSKTQTGSDLNNVIQYYDYSSSNVSLNGSSNNVATGSVLNTGQTSTGTRQILNNQADSTSGSASVLTTP